MRFARWVVFTFAIHVIVIFMDKGAGLVLYAITAENPQDKGAADLLTILPFIMMSVANLGLATASVYFLRRKEYTLEQVAETTSLVALIWGTLVAVLAILASQFVLPLIQPNWDFSLWYVIPICACVPFLLTTSYYNSIQLAADRVRDYNLVHLVASAVFLPVFFGLYFVVDSGVTNGIAFGRLLTAAVVTMVTLWMLRGIARWRPRMHWDFFKSGVTYGWKANLTSVLTYLNHRVDLYFLGFLYIPKITGVGPQVLKDLQLEQVAFYSMAVTFAELVWHFPEATRDLFFSKVAGSTHEQARAFTPILCRLCLTAAGVGAVVVYFIVDPVMTCVDWVVQKDAWGAKWSEQVGGCMQALIPGTVAFTVAKILQNDLAARGHLNHCLVACCVVLVTMISLDIALVPSHGAFGAAVASSVAYGASAVYTLFAYWSAGGTNPSQCLLIRRSDWSYARQVIAAVREKIWRPRS